MCAVDGRGAQAPNNLQSSIFLARDHDSVTRCRLTRAQPRPSDTISDGTMATLTRIPPVYWFQFAWVDPLVSFGTVRIRKIPRGSKFYPQTH